MMDSVTEFLQWVVENGDLLVSAASIIGMMVFIIISRARGQALDAVVDGVAVSGNKAVMKIIKEQFHAGLKGLARYILSERATRANKKHRGQGNG